jgi:hypothetical protein
MGRIIAWIKNKRIFIKGVYVMDEVGRITSLLLENISVVGGDVLTLILLIGNNCILHLLSDEFIFF